MISPTGYAVRQDSAGNGNLGAARGTRIHGGTDYYCVEGQAIVAPFNMTITRPSYPNRDQIMQGIAWKFGKSTGRLWYFTPHANLIGKRVEQGDIIGVAQSVSSYYCDDTMNDHIHFQVNTKGA